MSLGKTRESTRKWPNWRCRLIRFRRRSRSNKICSNSWTKVRWRLKIQRIRHDKYNFNSIFFYQYPKASNTASATLGFQLSILLFFTSGCPRLFITTITIFLYLSAQAIIPVDPSCPKHDFILWEGQVVPNP